MFGAQFKVANPPLVSKAPAGWLKKRKQHESSNCELLFPPKIKKELIKGAAVALESPRTSQRRQVMESIVRLLFKRCKVHELELKKLRSTQVDSL